MQALTANLALGCLVLLPFWNGCGGDSDSKTAPNSGSDAATPASDRPSNTDRDCSRGALEADFAAAPLAGPAVRDGALSAGDYVVSSTYVQLKSDGPSQQRFGELMGPIMVDLQSRDGLLAISLGRSNACGTGRTLSVWRNEVAMFGFVTSDAHSRAIASVGEVSRGGSIVTHWTGDADSASWQSAAEHLLAAEGPFY